MGGGIGAHNSPIGWFSSLGLCLDILCFLATSARTTVVTRMKPLKQLTPEITATFELVIIVDGDQYETI